MLNNNRCRFNQLELSSLLRSVPSPQVSVAMLYYNIFMVSIGSSSIWFPSLSTFFSGECGNAILQYCYGFNMRQLWLLAQRLFQSVLSHQVSVAMPYYSIVIGFNRHQLWLSLLAQGLLQSVLSLQMSVAMPYYSIVIGFNMYQLWLSFLA